MQEKKINTWEEAKKYKSKKLFILKPDREDFVTAWPEMPSPKIGEDTVTLMEKMTDYDSSCYSSPLAAILSRLAVGLMPSTESMMSMANCFSKYFEENGKLELEEVFFGKTKKGVGNFSARRATRINDDIFVMLHIAIIERSRDQNYEGWSDVEIAEFIIPKYRHSSHKDADSLLRSYRRKLKDSESVLAKFVKIDKEN